MSNIFRSKLEKVVEEISVYEIQDALKRVIVEKPKDIVRDFLREINFSGKICAHPLIRSAVNIPNMMKSKNVKGSEYYKKLNDKLIRILKEGMKAEDIIEIKDLLENLKNKAIDYITEQEVGKIEQGLRHIHAPGSVAKSEGRNLYFPGEKYAQETLYRLASRLCDSIALGDSIGIYSENEDLMVRFKQLAYQKFKSKFKIELKGKDLDISEDEANYPYAVLLGFTFWLAKLLLIEEEHEIRALVQSILDYLKTSAISLFFMPPEKEKWSTINLPRLDIFIDKWVLNEESRDKIETLRSELKHFITDARRKAKREGEVKEIENTIDLLMNNYDAFCHRLIEYGDLDLYALRGMMDIIVDLGTKYGLKMYLKPLGSVIRC
jgi:hypothetical protein